MNRRLMLLALVGYVVLLVGLGTTSGALLLLLVPLVIMMGMGILYAPTGLEVHITRETAVERISEGREIAVTVRLTNRGRPLEEAAIELRPDPALEVVEGDLTMITALDAGQTVEMTYTVRGTRGTYSFAPARVMAYDRFMMRTLTEEIEPEGLGSLDVLPDVTRLSDITLRPLQTRIYAGNIPARIGGSGVDFFTVRPYQPADQLRHINWMAMARHQEALFTNEFEQERIADVNIILDTRQRTNSVLPGHSIFEYGVSAAAALAEVFIKGGNRVSLLLYGHILEWTPPGYGKIQREKILRSLSRATTGYSQVFDTFTYLPTRFFPNKSQIVLVSTLLDDSPEYIIKLRGQAYEVLIVSPNPIPFEAKIIRDEPGVKLAERVATLERRILLRKLRQAGVRIVDWDVTRDPLAGAVATSLARQPARTTVTGVLR